MEKVVHPILSPLHLPLYHDNPEFHASFAWCLLRSGSSSDSSSSSDAALDADQSEMSSDMADSPFIPAVLRKLNGDFEQLILSSQPSAGWTIDSIDLKISKDVVHMPLKL